MWDAINAVATVAAVVVALGLAVVERARARSAEKQLEQLRQKQLDIQVRAVADLISAWVDIRVTPSPSARHYVRQATVHVENQSDSPAYDANISIGVQNSSVGWTSVGPLTVPLPISVVPPRSKQSWDVTLPLMACTADLGGLPYQPAVRIAFSDPSGRRWARGFGGDLEQRAEGAAVPLFSADPGTAPDQLGDLQNPFNPAGVVLAFKAALAREGGKPLVDEARALTDPTAAGWAGMQRDQWDSVAAEFEDLGMASYVHYPAPRVAYVKLLTDDAADLRVTSPGYVTIPATIVTLRFIRSVGWRIFAIGHATPVDAIEFPEADLDCDPREPTTEHKF